MLNKCTFEKAADPDNMTILFLKSRLSYVQFLLIKVLLKYNYKQKLGYYNIVAL
jgi:hypothetical protein